MSTSFASPDWREHTAQRAGTHSNLVVRDVESHLSLSQFRYYSSDTVTTTVHECSHAIHANLRNAAAGLAATERESTLFLKYKYENHKRLPQPSRFDKVLPANGVRVNAFYSLKDKYCILPEPGFRKRDIIEYIPADQQSNNLFRTYVSGQSAWDDRPLYVWDEWNCYVNGCYASSEAYTLEASIAFCYYARGVYAKLNDSDISYAKFLELVGYFVHNVMRIQDSVERFGAQQHKDSLGKFLDFVKKEDGFDI